MSKSFQVGDIIRNSMGQFAKILTFQHGMYGISDWNTKTAAKNATVAYRQVNSIGLVNAGAYLVTAGKPSKRVTPLTQPEETTDDKPTKTELSKLSAEDVRAHAEELGVSTEGTKPEILERLYKHYDL